jgi:hypothetical protein
MLSTITNITPCRGICQYISLERVLKVPSFKKRKLGIISRNYNNELGKEGENAFFS